MRGTAKLTDVGLGTTLKNGRLLSTGSHTCTQPLPVRGSQLTLISRRSSTRWSPCFRKLLNSSPHTIENGLRNLPRKGVYAFYENGEAIYVGRSNRIRDRIREHGAESSKHESATFAYKLMLEEVGEQGGHSSQLSRHDLQNQYEDKYRGQRKRIREMEVRTVAIEDQRVQAVLEIYAILALGTTKYNSFQTT